MGLIEIIKGKLTSTKELNVKKLPSLGLFYKDDFKIFIKKVSIEDIVDYESGFEIRSVTNFLSKIKKIVKNYTVFSKNYTFNDIRAVDLIFIFIEIVKYTKDKEVQIPFYYIDFDEDGNEIKHKECVDFNSDNFLYFELSEELEAAYNEKEKCFDLYGYKYSSPTIGVENSLSEYLSQKMKTVKDIKDNNLSYLFTRFLSEKNSLSSKEIENLITIFNEDMDENEKDKISYISSLFEDLNEYIFVKDELIIPLGHEIDLENIFK